MVQRLIREEKKNKFEGFILDKDCLATAAEVSGRKRARKLIGNWRQFPNCQIRKEKKTIEGFRLDNDCLATAAEVRGGKGAKN